MTSTPAITCNTLVKEFGRRKKRLRAVDGLSLNVPQGTIYGFLGPNGAGKTTTIRMLLGLIKPNAGETQILGQAVRWGNPAVFNDVGALVEAPVFYPYLSAADNLRLLGLTAGDDNPARQQKVLEIVRLAGRAKDKVETFSHGMKQRLGVAMALLNDPDLLILDEPTSGLDPAGMVEMRDLFRELNAAGKTIFLSSHLLSEVEQTCDMVAIINKGRLVAEGSVAELLTGQPRLEIQARPLDKAVSVLDATGGSGPVLLTEGWLALDAPPDDAPAVVQTLVAAGVDVLQVRVEKCSLERFFLSVTNDEITERSA